MANKSGVGIGIFGRQRVALTIKIILKMNLLPDLFVYSILFEWVLTKLGYAKAEFPIITRPSASNIALRPREFGGVLRDEPTREVFFGMTITPWDEVLSRLSPVQTDARLLANNSQHC